MPDSTDYQFRQAIAARTVITRHLRRDNESDVGDQEINLNPDVVTTR